MTLTKPILLLVVSITNKGIQGEVKTCSEREENFYIKLQIHITDRKKQSPLLHCSTVQQWCTNRVCLKELLEEKITFNLIFSQTQVSNIWKNVVLETWAVDRLNISIEPLGQTHKVFKVFSGSEKPQREEQILLNT